MRVLFASILLVPYIVSLGLNTEFRSHSSVITSAKTDSTESDTLIKMERTVCFGTCPAYELIIQRNGKVIFKGKEFVEHKGEATGKISQDNLDRLVKKIEESHFMEISSDPECESRYTDMPSVFLTIESDGQRNSVSHYQGCKGFQFEEDLYDLEEVIDSLAGTSKWIGKG